MSFNFLAFAGAMVLGMVVSAMAVLLAGAPPYVEFVGESDPPPCEHCKRARAALRPFALVRVPPGAHDDDILAAGAYEVTPDPHDQPITAGHIRAAQDAYENAP